MVGDSLTEDVEAANRCSIPAVHVCREGNARGEPFVRDLNQLRELLESGGALNP